jgi:hypothetical protein
MKPYLRRSRRCLGRLQETMRWVKYEETVEEQGNRYQD